MTEQEFMERLAAKLYELAGYDDLHIKSFPEKAWGKISEKAKLRWYARADKIHALILQAGYVSKEEIEKLEVIGDEKILDAYYSSQAWDLNVVLEKVAKAQLQHDKDTLLGKKG